MGEARRRGAKPDPRGRLRHVANLTTEDNRRFALYEGAGGFGYVCEYARGEQVIAAPEARAVPLRDGTGRHVTIPEFRQRTGARGQGQGLDLTGASPFAVLPFIAALAGID